MKERLAVRPPGYRYTLGRVLAVYAGLMATLFLSALDQTIVVTALPSIVADVGGFGSYSWVVTAYMLALTVTVPLYGKLVDVYGARPLLLGALAIFVVGSGICGAAQGMTDLVVFRAIQGVGAGALVPIALATVGTLVPARERGRYQGFIGATIAAAAIAGPPLGGVIADGPGWRWIFLLNLPVGAVALVVVWLTMPRESRRTGGAIDYPGAALLALGTGALMLGLIWGGNEYAWGSPQVVIAFLGSALTLGLFWAVERRAPETILPFELLRQRAVALGVISLVLLGVAMLGTVVFVPLFVQGVVGESATSSGLLTMPFLLSTVVASVVSGLLVTRSGRYKVNAVVGLAVLAAGLLLVWRMDMATSGADVARNAVVAGVGLGLSMQVLVVAVQNAVPLDRMGSASALIHFARSIGCTFGVTIMGVIATRDLPRGLDVRGPVPAVLPDWLGAELVDALRPAFLFAACVCIAALLVVLLGLREEPLRRSFDEVGTVES